MKTVGHLLLFVYLIYFAACVEDSISADDNIHNALNYHGVDPALWVHFRAFEQEALNRGIDVNLALHNIEGTIRDIDSDNVVGTCSYNRFNNNDVVIDRSFWFRAPHLYREYIVFHELGHCVLFRDHLDACFANRTYVSLMRSGTGNCVDNYHHGTRDYYLDELFDSVLP